jgi:23S rRNA (pseudouridine1915-N3)-methyltransferase
MKRIHLFVFGKYRIPSLAQLEEEYKRRLQILDIQIHQFKPTDRKNNEKIWMEKIAELQKRETIEVILCEEKGALLNSPQFSASIFTCASSLLFSIGPSDGHPQEIRERYKRHISLSTMTLPHQLARLVLVEQIYRAETIYQGHPYHHE